MNQYVPLTDEQLNTYEARCVELGLKNTGPRVVSELRYAIDEIKRLNTEIEKLTQKNRCDAICQVAFGTWKKCIRNTGHFEPLHVWVESIDRADGNPIIVFWEGDEPAVGPTHVRFLHTTAK